MYQNNGNKAINIQKSIPDDIALKIASTLEVCDVCSLCCCSRFWRELIGSDCVWEGLCKDRWPGIILVDDKLHHEIVATPKGWKGLYTSKHNEISLKANSLKSFLERALSSESMEVGDYLKAIELLKSMKFGFKDVQMFLLKPNLNVLLNLIAIHYSIICLRVPAEHVIEALHNRKISKRQVCVQWWKLEGWYYGFRLLDELHVSLKDLAAHNEQVLGVLCRRANHEVIYLRSNFPC